MHDLFCRRKTAPSSSSFQYDPNLDSRIDTPAQQSEKYHAHTAPGSIAAAVLGDKMMPELPAYSPPGKSPVPPGVTQVGSGQRVRFPRVDGVMDPRNGLGDSIAEDWGHDPVFMGTAVHADGSYHPGAYLLRLSNTRNIKLM